MLVKHRVGQNLLKVCRPKVCWPNVCQLNWPVEEYMLRFLLIIEGATEKASHFTIFILLYYKTFYGRNLRIPY
jgi:hypothetical protein